MDAEEYAVLSAVLGAGGPFLIKDETEHWQDVAGGREGFNAELKQSSKELLDETIEDYWAKNRNPHKLAARFDTKMRYTFISAEYLDNLFKAKGPLAGWEEFYKKYPKYGFVTFSRVGFSADKTQALVYHSYGCGPMCGGGGYLLLVKKGGVWIEKGSVGSSWVS
ncbi:MAG TPA: hypothetical protein VJ866_21065 [Pyrinomonadaceae bacterium]|nr:hypothetical protein [Pyrinomonadaceae bacterium]